jgi:transcriptional regulator with XRE-family HTH domain
MSLFSKNLRFLRKKGNHNQEAIAILFHKQANTIGNWENQKSEPSLGELMKLADFFKVSTEDLLQKDLESSQSGNTPQTDISSPEPKTISWPEVPAKVTGEAGADAFWLIIRELRAIQLKVDLLVSQAETAGPKRNSDKSYH